MDSGSGLTSEGVRVAEASSGAGLEGERGVDIERGARNTATGECV